MLAEKGAENPKGSIFSIGRDAGVPHTSGTGSDILRLGETIVFDIFPCEQGGGYYYDFTRTWCLGYATEEAQALFEDVRAVYNQIMGELCVGRLCRSFQERTCVLFEDLGHATIKSDEIKRNSDPRRFMRDSLFSQAAIVKGKPESSLGKRYPEKSVCSIIGKPLPGMEML